MLVQQQAGTDPVPDPAGHVLQRVPRSAGQRAFAEVILNPPKPSAGLERAFASHELLIREMR